MSQLLSDYVSSPLSERIEFNNAVLDSREVSQGDLMIIPCYLSSWAEQAAKDAEQRGASAILLNSQCVQLKAELAIPVVEVDSVDPVLASIASEFWGGEGYPKLIGVTGTNGKTSVSFLVASLLQQCDIEMGVMGTLGAGRMNALIETGYTTPDVFYTHQLLHDLKQAEIETVAMEISSHGIEQGRIAGLSYDVLVYTNLSQDHLDYHGTMEAYAAAKRKLFEDNPDSTFVVNLDDALGQVIARLSNKQCWGYSLKPQNGEHVVYARDYALTINGIEAQVITPLGEVCLKAPLFGRFNLYNMLAAVCVGLTQGLTLYEIQSAVETLKLPAGRMEKISEHPLVIVDFAHTPDALKNALSALRHHVRGELICVFGCGGDRDKSKRPLMGRVASEHADTIWVTSDNPRSESPNSIVDGICAGIESAEGVYIEVDRKRAIERALINANGGDVVLIAGKGHEKYQLINGKRLPFDDVQVAKQALELRV